MQKNRIRTSDYWSYYDVLYRIQLCDHRKDCRYRPDRDKQTTKSSVQWSPILALCYYRWRCTYCQDKIINQINQN
jgi:hypothetical protein